MPTQRLICEYLLIIVKIYLLQCHIHKKEQNADICYNMDKPQK